MFCPYCGTQVADDDLFCWNCGSKIAASPKAPSSGSQSAASRPSAEEGNIPTHASLGGADASARPAARQQQSSPRTASPSASSGSGFAGSAAAGRTPASGSAGSQPRRAQAPAESRSSAGTAQAGNARRSQARPAQTGNARRASAPAARAGSSGKTGSFYLIDFLVRMFTNKENVPLIIYLVLNILLIGLITTAMLTLPIGWGLLCGFLLYVASVSIALSPIGEALLRYQTGCHKITDQTVIDRMEPIFREVYTKARQADPSISADVRLFMNDEDCPNAFATGRKTVCITRGLLTLPDELIKATLGHEFGHLSHKDTDRILVVAIGNLFIEGLYILFQLGAILADIIMQIVAAFSGDANVFVSLMSSISRFFTLVILAAFMRLWTALGTALCMKTSRGNEFQADEFSVHLGYADGLVHLLQIVGGGPRPKGLFASLASSHPHSDDRIARIRELAETGSARA